MHTLNFSRSLAQDSALNIINYEVMSRSSEATNSGNRGCLWLCRLLFWPFPPSGLPHPALAEVEVPSVTASWYTMAGWYLWEACLYLRRNRGGMDGGEGQLWGEEGGETLVGTLKQNKQKTQANKQRRHEKDISSSLKPPMRRKQNGRLTSGCLWVLTLHRHWSQNFPIL